MQGCDTSHARDAQPRLWTSVLSPAWPTLKHLCPTLVSSSQVHRDHTDSFLKDQRLSRSCPMPATSQGHRKLPLLLHVFFLLSLPALSPSGMTESSSVLRSSSGSGKPSSLLGTSGNMSSFSCFASASRIPASAHQYHPLRSTDCLVIGDPMPVEGTGPPVGDSGCKEG